jgi:hypothetical protein
VNKRIVFIDNGHTFANNMDGAWNGDYTKMAKRAAGLDINRNGSEWAESMKPLVQAAKKNKKGINDTFEALNLPKAEQKAFWDRVAFETKAIAPGAYRPKRPSQIPTPKGQSF